MVLGGGYHRYHHHQHTVSLDFTSTSESKNSKVHVRNSHHGRMRLCQAVIVEEGGEAATATCFRHGSKDLMHTDSSNENLFMDGRQKSKRPKYSMSQYIVFLRFNVLCVCPSFSTVSSTVALKIDKTRRRAER
ncbi:hypothetical protein SNK05_003056 [Fusarium graminearum]